MAEPTLQERWVPFIDRSSNTVAVMSGEKPTNGRWSEIIAWTGFDGSSLSFNRRAELARQIAQIPETQARMDALEERYSIDKWIAAAVKQQKRAIRLEAQNKALQEEIGALQKRCQAEWFYPADEEGAYDSVHEVAESALFSAAPGLQILRVESAAPQPSIWCVAHVLSEDEQDEIGDGTWFKLTQYASEAEARAALAATEKADG